MRRIVVSGAGGFLGSNIIREALSAHVKVVAITEKTNVDNNVGVVNTKDFLTNGYPLSDEDVFINCFFPTNADGIKMANGLEKLFSMIAQAYLSGVGAFINISSQSVYASERTAAAKESDMLSLDTPYAVGKYSGEAFVNQVFLDRPHTNIRMASLLGVGYNQRIVNRMIIQAMNDEPLKVVGGMQRYGFLDVRDAADGLLKIATSDPTTWRRIYNLGRNESYSLVDVVKCIVKEMKSQTDTDVTYTVSEGKDRRNSALDASQFMSDFDWEPNYTLSDTVATIIRNSISYK